MHSKYLLLLCVLLLCTNDFGQTASDQKSVSDVLQTYLTRLSSHGYSFAVLVEKDGTVLHHKAHGYSGTSALTNDTLFDVASVSKQFTASAIMLLAQQRKLDVHNSISAYLPDVPKSMQGITVHHLLTHSSGIRDDYDLYEERPVMGREEFLREVFKRKPAFAPGSKMEYSNDAYGMLAAIVERISQLPFENYVRHHLLKPAGMIRTGFVGETWMKDPIAISTGGILTVVHRERSWSGALGASNVLTNVGELRRWDLAIRENRILSKETLETMWTPYVDGPADLKYGYGWWIRKSQDGTRAVWHSGHGDTGFNAWYLRYPEKNLLFLFTSNMDLANSPLRESLFSPIRNGTLEKIVFGETVIMPPETIDSEAELLKRSSGNYKLPGGGWFQIEPHRKGLRVIPHGQDAFDLLLPGPVEGQEENYGDLLTGLQWNQNQKKQLMDATENMIRILSELRLQKIDAYAKATGRKKADIVKNVIAPFDAFEVLGTTPLDIRKSGRYLVTVSKIWRGPQETQIYSVWFNDELTQLFEGSDPFPIPTFRQTGSSRFYNFHPFLQASAGMEIVFTEDDRRILFQTEKGIVTAYK